jgi:hypothetical protein
MYVFVQYEQQCASRGRAALEVVSNISNSSVYFHIEFIIENQWLATPSVRVCPTSVMHMPRKVGLLQIQVCFRPPKVGLLPVPLINGAIVVFFE